MIVQADISQPAQLERLFERVSTEFGSLDIFVANARPEVAEFYQPAMAISFEQWDAAMNSQAKSQSPGRRRSPTGCGRRWRAPSTASVGPAGVTVSMCASN
ncbi:MAG TPA: SDR family oxidoreductase [Gemmatimonadaceae bacterium]|nr:SDR family oxidoreductase [Gemmatimonadaceae bacterium]